MMNTWHLDEETVNKTNLPISHEKIKDASKARGKPLGKPWADGPHCFTVNSGKLRALKALFLMDIRPEES